MSKFHVNLITLFPDMFPSTLGMSISGKALERGDWSFEAINPRDYAEDKHKTVDDTPFGGGAGMVMKADILEKAYLDIKKTGKTIYMSPRGKVLNQKMAQELSNQENITIICGRYEGIDQRFLDAHNIEEISIGDYVLSGGEPAAIILMDACIRLLDGVMGNSETVFEESHSNGLLEYPHYTRPAVWVDNNGVKHNVPDILKEGHHKKINEWRLEQSEELTKKTRPDLWDKYNSKK